MKNIATKPTENFSIDNKPYTKQSKTRSSTVCSFSLKVIFGPSDTIPAGTKRINEDCRPIQRILANLKPSLIPYIVTGRSPIAFTLPQPATQYHRGLIAIDFRRAQLKPILSGISAHDVDVLAEGLHDNTLPSTGYYSTPVEDPDAFTLVIHHSRETLNLALVFIKDGMTDDICVKVIPSLGSLNRLGNSSTVDSVRLELESVFKPMMEEERMYDMLPPASSLVEKVILTGDDTKTAHLKCNWRGENGTRVYEFGLDGGQQR